MGIVQKDALRTMILSYVGLVLGYYNKGLLFVKILDTEEIGLVNLLVSLGTLFGTFASLGMGYIIWKYFPMVRGTGHHNRGILSWASINSFLGALLFTAIVIVLQPQIVDIYGSRSPLFVEYYYWLIPLGVASVAFQVLEYYLRSLYHNVISVLAFEIVLRGLITLSLFALQLDFLDFHTFLMAHIAIYFVPPLIMAGYLMKRGLLHLNPRKIRLPKLLRRQMLNFGLFTYANSIISLVILSLDALMITAMIGLEATGVYTTITFLASALQVPYKSMMRVTSAIIADLWQKNDLPGLAKLYKTFSTINLYVGSFMFLLVWLPRDQIFSYLPDEYLAGIPIFFFLMIGRMWDMYSGINGTIFITSTKYRYDLIYSLALVVIVYLLNLYLIPIYGASGAAIATSSSYVLFNIARIVSVYLWFRVHLFEWRQLFIILFVSITWAGIEFLPLNNLLPLVGILIKWSLLGGMFMAPVYFTNWLPEVRGYLDRGMGVVLKRFRS